MTNLIPISYMSGLTPAQSGVPAQAQTSAVPFAQMFEDAVTNLENLNAIKEQDAIDLSLGNIDNLALLQTNSEKAEIALQLLVEMRNKLLDGYNEIMRIGV